MAEGANIRLQSGETTMWKGQPHQGLLLRPIEVFVIPFSLLWAGFALYWNITVWSVAGDLFFKLFGLPFLIAGVYITVGRFWIDMRLRRATTYSVTDQRVLIARGSKIVSLDIRHLPALELTEYSDGLGTIRFGPAASWFGGNNLSSWQPTLDPVPQFMRIAQARAVYEMIRGQAGR